MKNSNKTREKITGVLVGLVLSALCVTPALAAGMDSTSLSSPAYEIVKFVRDVCTIASVLFAAMATYGWVMSMIESDPISRSNETVLFTFLTIGLFFLSGTLDVLVN